MTAEAVCSQIDSRTCHLHGETFVFEVESASMAAGHPGHALLQIAAFRRTASGPAFAASVRVTAPFDELERVPALLATALEEFLLRTAPLSRVH